MANKRGQAKISECSKYDVVACEREKKVILKVQNDQKLKGNNFSIPVTIKYIIGKFGEQNNLL